MKHAGDEALDFLEDLLARLRTIDGLQERKRGVFYRNGRAFLHFHEDAAGMFADLQPGTGWERCEVTGNAQRAALLRRVRNLINEK